MEVTLKTNLKGFKRNCWSKNLHGYFTYNGKPHNIGYFNLSEYMEVIGNIYDNPELLNK